MFLLIITSFNTKAEGEGKSVWKPEMLFSPQSLVFFRGLQFLLFCFLFCFFVFPFFTLFLPKKLIHMNKKNSSLSWSQVIHSAGAHE